MALHGISILLAATATAGSQPQPPPSTLRDPTDTPNFVMLFVDDLGYGDVGFNGHPTTSTPNIDRLAIGGKVLSSWYSGCPVCSGSRAALMTGRQFARLGVPGVFGPTVNNGLNTNETVIAAQLKKKNYKTAAMGKWHLGQRPMYLPGQRGFDHYLGIPYSDDMGAARRTACGGAEGSSNTNGYARFDSTSPQEMWGMYEDMNYTDAADPGPGMVEGAKGGMLPLVYQTHDEDGKLNTTVLEQPLDFTHLAEKYNTYVLDFIEQSANDPFFLYMPFSHVHTTAGNQPDEQYSGCMWRNTSLRGAFGDALSEVDWIVGNVHSKIESLGLLNNTLFFFTGDNGPWLIKAKSGGSEGLLTGRFSGYWNTGKGSAWEGGIHEAGFAYWPGQIAPFTRSAEIVSSLDVFVTISSLAGIPLPENVVYDGRDMSDVILDRNGGKSKHEVLFFYGGAGGSAGGHGKGPTAGRFGRYKFHWCTGPGLGGGGDKICYTDVPLLFDVWEDPSEAYPLAGVNGSLPDEFKDVVQQIVQATNKEIENFVHGSLVNEPLLPGEIGDGTVAICCDHDPEIPNSKQPSNYSCDCNGKPYPDF